jgi:undecaprenyl-diphosphatase
VRAWVPDRIAPSLQPLALLLALAGLILAGWGVGELVSGPLDPTVGALDRDIVDSVATWRGPGLTAFMKKATFFGSTAWLIGSLAVVVVVALYSVRSPRWAVFAVGCMIGGFISTIVKALVERPRPDIEPLLHIESAAFPSGHALAAAIAFGAVGLFLTRVTRLPRMAVWLGAALCAGIVGLTRTYLGVHWPTDVIGGWLLGAAWVAVVALVVRPERKY